MVYWHKRAKDQHFNLPDCEFFLFLFVCLSFVLVLFSHLSHQTGPTVILPFSLEPGTTTPAGVNL